MAHNYKGNVTPSIKQRTVVRPCRNSVLHGTIKHSTTRNYLLTVTDRWRGKSSRQLSRVSLARAAPVLDIIQISKVRILRGGAHAVRMAERSVCVDIVLTRASLVAFYSWPIVSTRNRVPRSTKKHARNVARTYRVFQQISLASPVFPAVPSFGWGV